MKFKKIFSCILSSVFVVLSVNNMSHAVDENGLQIILKDGSIIKNLENDSYEIDRIDILIEPIGFDNYKILNITYSQQEAIDKIHNIMTEIINHGISIDKIHLKFNDINFRETPSNIPINILKNIKYFSMAIAMKFKNYPKMFTTVFPKAYSGIMQETICLDMG